MRALCVLLLVLCAIGGACRRQPVPEPPVPADLDAMDPDVRARVNEALASLRAEPRDAARWMRLGMTYEAHVLNDPAKQCYEEARQLAPDDPRAWYRVALLRERTGDLRGAIDGVEVAIGRDPGYAPAHWRRGFWLLDEGNAPEAMASFQRAVSLAPDDPVGWIGLARGYLQQHDAAHAREVLERLLAGGASLPRNLRQYVVRLLASAARTASDAPGAPPVAPVRAAEEPTWSDPWASEVAQYRTGFAALYKNAIERSTAGDYRVAAALFEQLRQKRPADVTLLNQLAVCYLADKRFADGIGVLVKAAELEPNRPETHLNLASAALETDDLPRALTEARRAIVLDRRLGKAYEVSGAVLARSGQSRDALEAFEAAVRYDPQNTIALVSAGMLEGAQGRFDTALGKFERASQIDPTDADAYLGIAIVGLRSGKLDAAEAALEQARALRANDPRVQAGFAELQARRARPPASGSGRGR